MKQNAGLKWKTGNSDINGKAPTDIQRAGESPQVSVFRTYKQHLSLNCPAYTENASLTFQFRRTSSLEQNLRRHLKVNFKLYLHAV